MALANFFDKVNLGASQILEGYERTLFESKLLSNCIGIRYTDDALQCYEGHVALDLLVRLLSRLYPNVKFIYTGVDSNNHTQKLKYIAQEINPRINLEDNQNETFVINIGSVPEYQPLHQAFYIGSDNWKAYHSTLAPQGLGESNNPFGAAASVCIACANLFRALFNDELGKPLIDHNLCFSTFSQSISPVEDEPELQEKITLDCTLIGAGAIGNAVLWSLLQLKNTNGRISLVDKEAVSLSNLQRYVLMNQKHVKISKVEVINELFQQSSRLTILPYPYAWQEVIGNLQLDQTELVATALDTTIERVLVQSTLPKSIINAWTSPDCIGVSRHFDFINDICLSCLYLPTVKVKSESEKIAEALNMQQNELFIRQYLANNKLIDDQFINIVSQIGGIAIENLNQYKNHPVRVLYSDGICGGRILSVQANGQIPQDMEVPLAHESAMAGILLAAEILIYALHLRKKPIEPLTKLNLVSPLHLHLREKEEKSYTGKCLCQDELFQDRYKDKWCKS